MILVAPTEPAALKSMLTRLFDPERVAVSSLPETCGVDVYWTGGGLSLGLQRKAWKDLLASAEDGRLAREAMQWGELFRAILLVEGRPKTDPSGAIIGYQDKGSRWTLAAMRNLMRSCEAAGAWVEWAQDIEETAAIVGELVSWSRKGSHTSLSTRPGPSKDGLMRLPTMENWLLQSFPGIGRERADAILAHFGGLPMGWTVSAKELEGVPGIGPKLAQKMAEICGRC